MKVTAFDVLAPTTEIAPATKAIRTLLFIWPPLSCRVNELFAARNETPEKRYGGEVNTIHLYVLQVRRDTGEPLGCR
jgi:hypothetical protein